MIRTETTAVAPPGPRVRPFSIPVPTMNRIATPPAAIADRASCSSTHPTRPPLLPLGALLLAGSFAASAQTATGDASQTLSTVTVTDTAEPVELKSKNSLRTTSTSTAKGRQELRDIPQSVTVMTELLMDDRNLDDFREVLKTTAGVKTSPNGYVAMVQHYFASAWLLGEGVERENFVRKVDNNLYAVGMITPLGEVAPGQSKALENKLFVGPQEEKTLEALAPGLELLKDYGWLAMLAKPLYWLLDQLFKVIHNWGWAIMALVLLLKIAFYWLNAKAYASMAKMKAINPRIMAMRERLKDKPQEMQMEMMKIYREEKVNPMGGCFPMLIQIPVFIALYWVLLSSVEMRHAPWVGWIVDLSAPDPYFLLPIFMTLTTLLQTALNPAPPDPMQAKMMWIMPLVFSVMFFFFPAGLVLYWITNNVLSIVQQWIINTRMGVPPQFNLPKFK